MSLSCGCDFEYDGDGWFWKGEFETKLPVGRRKRCCSCNELINITDTVMAFPRFRNAHSDIEERIHGEFVPLAKKYMCESCSGLFQALTELGYCIGLGDDMRDLVGEHNYMKLEN